METCCNCGKKLDAHTPVEGKDKPVEGDFSLCFYCGHIFYFDENLALQSATIKQFRKLPFRAYKQLLLIQSGIETLKRK